MMQQTSGQGPRLLPWGVVTQAPGGRLVIFHHLHPPQDPDMGHLGQNGQQEKQ